MKTSKKLILVFFALVLVAAGCHRQSPQSGTDSPAGQESAANNTPAAVTPPDIKVSHYVEYSGKDGKSALDLLEDKYKVVTKNYSGVGEFVMSIGDVSPDSKHFWEFFVNGKSSNVGASSYITKDNDVLEWKLSEIK